MPTKCIDAELRETYKLRESLVELQRQLDGFMAEADSGRSGLQSLSDRLSGEIAEVDRAIDFLLEGRGPALESAFVEAEIRNLLGLGENDDVLGAVKALKAKAERGTMDR